MGVSGTFSVVTSTLCEDSSERKRNRRSTWISLKYMARKRFNPDIVTYYGHSKPDLCAKKMALEVKKQKERSCRSHYWTEVEDWSNCDRRRNE
jgi:hypothetical protein